MIRIFPLLLCLIVFVGCSKEEAPVTLQLNWKPEPQFGGFYAADYAKHGLNVDVRPGGAGTPTIELLGAGKVPYAVVSADEIPKAREQGIKVVALFAVYQKHPQGVITQSKRGLKSLEDLFKTPGTLAMESGLPYSDFLKNKYGFDKLKIVPSPFGDLSVLRTDDTYAMQCFVTSEPLAAKKDGLDVTTFLIADSGYNPYATVLATTEEYLRANNEQVRLMVEAVAGGWRKYLEDPAATNTLMHGLNPTMDTATFADSAAAQKPLIENDETKQNGIGVMTIERWQTLIDQLKTLKVITTDIMAADCFKPLVP
ncbi:MAG TPA: ABC transporter substrate-binding protein [Tepidisphaeraceae bacterium]